MCGINGIYTYRTGDHEVDTEELRITRDHMRSRGPDGCGSWVSKDSRVGLGHRRLAIIDLGERAAQPMCSADRKLWIVFNGEIYNYKQLREDLKSQGLKFKTRSDTEVLLQLYRLRGESMLLQLRGMFAFAIWDDTKRALFLARDRYGIKPLYYSDDGETFRFASQVSALLAGGNVSQDVDPGGVTGFFLWGSVPEPSTLYKEIKALPSGCFLKIEPSGCGKTKAFWSIRQAIQRAEIGASRIGFGEEEEYVRHALRDSVASHMVADVPVGGFLSAGLDSSNVIGLASEISPTPIQTITLGFEEFKSTVYDETIIAAQMATMLGTRHLCRRVDIQEFDLEFPNFLRAMDQPTIDGVNTWFVSKAASEAGLKVALSGLGGDELLGGYNTFDEVPKMVRTISKMPRIRPLGRIFQIFYTTLLTPLARPPFRWIDPKDAGFFLYGDTFEGAYQLRRGVFMPWELSSVLDKDFAASGMSSLEAAARETTLIDSTPVNDFAHVIELESTRYMRNQLLRDTDWTGMAHSLEIRVPLVDHELTEKIAGLAIMGRLGKGKAILHRILQAGLPPQAVTRSKTGFTVPFWRWLHISKQIDHWKNNKALRKGNIGGYKRLAYSIASTIPEVEAVLV